MQWHTGTLRPYHMRPSQDRKIPQQPPEMIFYLFIFLAIQLYIANHAGAILAFGFRGICF